MPWDEPQPDPLAIAKDFAATVATRLALNLADYLLDRLGVPKPPPGPPPKPPADVARQLEKDNPIDLKKGRDFEILE